MSNHNSKTTRWLKPKDCLDGSQEWTSTTHAANIGGEIHVKPHLPGIIIFVHGVNSEGEWYDDAERDICDGLNERLNLTNTPYKLEENIYYQPTFILDKNNYDNSHYIYEQPIRTLKKVGNSPVIRFYWGYRATEDDLGEYVIPLKNKQGESYHRLVEEMINPEYSSPNKNSWNAEDKHKYSIVQQYESLSYKKRRLFIYEKLKDKGPFFWGGGPFQNGCNNLISLWSDSGFSNWPMLWGSIPVPTPFPINVQALNPESDRLLTKAPPRKYYAHAVNRLAKLIKKICDYNKHDTVTVISHSQGTMIALAAAAIEAPDSLFVLNSPYSIEDKALNSFNYPYDENISEEVREATLSEIINKIAENKNKLKEHPSGVAGLVVGCSEDKKSWTPDIRLLKGRKRGSWLNNNIVTPTEENSIKERDNHGNTYIYCNPHDRVMGSSPLQSIGWSGIPNITKNNQTTPHPLFEKNNEPYVRMLARNTPCGDKPNPKTVFSDKNSYYSDGRIFWDSNTTTLHGIAWPPPPANMFININAPEVPYPIKKEELVNFDEDFPIKEVETDDKNKQTEKTKDITQKIIEDNEENNTENKAKKIPVGDGYGHFKYQSLTRSYLPVDSDYYFYKDFYSYGNLKWVPLTKEEINKRKRDPLLDPKQKNESMKYETIEDMKERIRSYIRRPTDHSTLPSHTPFLKRVLTYDLPIGYCEIGRSPEEMNELRKYADWLSGEDCYMETGELDIPKCPAIIKNPPIKK